MPTKKNLSSRKLKELTVEEFISLLDNWSETQKQSVCSTTGDWIKGRIELSKFLGCSVSTVYRNMREGLFDDATHRIGGILYFDKKAITEIKSQKLLGYAAG